MAYPELTIRLTVIREVLDIDLSQIASEIGEKDKTTAWRWLKNPGQLPPKKQKTLVAAICKHLSTKTVHKLREADFLDNDTMAFCAKLGLSKVKAALHCNYNLPIPEIFVDSALKRNASTERYSGPYLLFRHDKERDRPSAPYIQACVRINVADDGAVIYQDYWAGDSLQLSYSGYLIDVGSITNIIGQKNTSDAHAQQEMFWAGLQSEKDPRTNVIERISGYVSDLTAPAKGGRLFADRIILVRTTEDELKRVENETEFYVDRARMTGIAGEKLANFIDEWIDVPI